MERISSCKKLEHLDSDSLVVLLQKWDMHEFQDFVREKQMDGRKLSDVTEGIVKLWRPKADAKKFISFIQELKNNPDKYLKDIDEVDEAKQNDVSKLTTAFIESQYQTVTVRKVREENITSSRVEELLKRIVPAKSFLYRNQPKRDKITSYVPMDAGTPKKSRKFFRLSSYEYPNFDLRSRFSKTESFSDRGYYSIKTNNKIYIQKFRKPIDTKPKYRSISTTEELNEKFSEDHFYEDLCYNDMEKTDDVQKDLQKDNQLQIPNVKPCIVKIQELFQSFKFPFLRRNVEALEEEKEDRKDEVSEKAGPVYENSDSIANMYDSVRVNGDNACSCGEDRDKAQTTVEDYLEPVQLNRDYCDVNYKQRDDSILGYIMSIFETRFGMRRETNDVAHSEDSEDESKGAATPETNERKWPDERKHKTNMADRPLPVPVENEPYYMNIDRYEAENLLKGMPDGTFILRPSSQPNHAYTLSVSCSNAVHNVGVRRRPDGRLALGFARRGERSFTSVTSLLRHHRRRRLLLVAAGGVIGATTLNESPQYYQTPVNIPVLV